MTAGNTDSTGTVNDLEQMSIQFLRQTAESDQDATVTEELRRVDPERVLERLGETDPCKAFWLNVYNAGIQVLLTNRNESHGEEGYFDEPIEIALTELSLNDIEHGILRNGDPSGLGYEPTGPERFLTAAGPGETDPRIHFALNCGAKSCPPIRCYTAADIDRQLDVATESYVAGSIDYDPTGSVVRLPELFGWFSDDFGGEDGVVSFLQSYGAVPDAATPQVEYTAWDWTTVPENFHGDHP